MTDILFVEIINSSVIITSIAVRSGTIGRFCILTT